MPFKKRDFSPAKVPVKCLLSRHNDHSLADYHRRVMESSRHFGVGYTGYIILGEELVFHSQLGRQDEVLIHLTASRWSQC